MKLFKVILLLLLVAGIVPAAIVGWTSVSRTRGLLVTDAQELAQERVKRLRERTEALLDEPTGAVMALARVPDFFALDPAEQRAHIESILNQQRDVMVVTVFAADGRRVPGLQGVAVKEAAPTEIVEHETRASALLPGLTGLKYSEVYASNALPGKSAPVVTVVFPLGDPVKGYAAAEISLDELTSVLDAERFGSSGFAYVTDGNGRLIAGPNLGPLPVGADVSARPTVASLLHSWSSSPDAVGVDTFGKGDDRVVGAWSVLPDVGWAIVSEQPIDAAYRQVDEMKKQIAVGLFLATLVALALAALITRMMVSPVRKFTKAAVDIGHGNFGVQVAYRANNELGELAKTMNYMSAQIEAYDHETKRLYESLENGYLETIVALANSIDSKDAYTRGHSQRVGDVAVEIGRELGLTERELKHLHYGGILHDIGKIGIVESILCKQSRLTEEEMMTMRDHPLIGDQIIKPVSFLADVRAAVRNHHERWDGSGYPDRLKGDDIPLIARIVNCADTFDACTSTRPYQKAMPMDRAMEILEGLRGTQLDPKVIDALRRVVQKKGVKLEGSREPVKLAS